MSNLAKKRTGKTFLHKIYDSSNTYICTWGNEVMNTPKFNWAINGGMGEMQIDLARPINDYSENVEVKVSNRIKTFILDDDNKDGMQIYDGIITSYDPIVSQDGKEYIRIHVASQLKTLNDKILKSGNNTTLPYLSYDPSNIFTDILDKYAGVITYNSTSIVQTGTVASYTFSYVTCLEAIKKSLELCPAYWYWYIDGKSLFYLNVVDWDTTDHKLFFGKEAVEIDAKKSIEELYNAVYFVGGGTPNLYKLYERTSSIAEYGRREYKMQDDRVTLTTTAQLISDKFLDEHDHPTAEMRVKIVDKCIDNTRGYDIESFKPGDTVQIIDPQVKTGITLWDIAKWDVDYWDFDILSSLGQPLQIKNIDYNFDYCVLTLHSIAEEVSKRIEDIDRNLETVQSADIPSAPL